MITILLPGYNRLDNNIENLRMLLNLNVKGIQILVSIDGVKEDEILSVTERDRALEELVSLSDTGKCILHVYSNNLGVDQHIPQAISKAFEYSKGVIVLEDDILMSERALIALITKLESLIEVGDISPILGISSLTPRIIFNLSKKNFWRRSIYFSAWGYGFTAPFWRLHLKSSGDQVEHQDFPSNSRTWNRLSKRQQGIWNERFSRKNYDYEIQKTMFAYGLNSYAPLFRSIRNVGFQDGKSTHTRHRMPKYLRGSELSENILECRKGNAFWDLITKFLVYLDSNTWAGDGIFSVRGRNFGIRSVFRKYLTQKLTRYLH